MWLDIVFLICGGIIMVAGIAGCLLPVLPGPPLSYAGLLLLQLSSRRPFSVEFLVTFAVLTVVAVVLDYVIPVAGTKKFQGSNYGIAGSAFGLVIGAVFFPPAGIIIGPVLGAFLGEFIRNQQTGKAMRSAFGSLLGFAVGTVLKLALSVTMAYYFVVNAF